MSEEKCLPKQALSLYLQQYENDMYSVNALLIKGLDIGPLKIGWIGFISLVGILSMGWFYASVAFSKIKFL